MTKVLVVGGGGREHALAWKLAQSDRINKVFVAPGNAGTAYENGVENIAIAANDIDQLREFAQLEKVDLTIIGPEGPLVEGIVDRFNEKGLRCLGPNEKAAQLEGSKSFAKDFLQRHNIPTAAHRVFADANDALDWLENRDASKPFFLMLHHKAPHGKWEPAPRHKKYLAEVTIPEPPTLGEDFSHRSPDTRRMGTSITSRLAPRRTMVEDVQKPSWPAGSIDLSGMNSKEQGKAAYQKYLHDYLGCVKAVVENVGRVLDYLDRSGLSENTLVIYTADQGMFLGEHDYFDKRWIYEECFRMPFFARFPGAIPEGSVIDSQLCSNLDFAQTFLDFAEVNDAAEISSMQGHSLRPILQGKRPKEWRKDVYYRYWMHKAHHYIPGHYGVRDERYKLAFFYGLPLDANLGSRGELGPSTPGWEFYDLKKDPQETRNAYNDPQYAQEIQRLKRRLLELKAEFGDTDDKYPALMKVRQEHWDR